jgi:long-chain acyl-CoA synthetase
MRQKPKKRLMKMDGYIREFSTNHSGDIGEILPNQTLRIIDRIKNIFKLSQGEFVSPESIESKIKLPYFAQVFVHGESMQSYLILVATVDSNSFLNYLKSVDLTYSNVKEACLSQKVKDHVLNKVLQRGKEQNLKSFEIPKKLVLSWEEFSIENGLLTTTLKTKRKSVLQKYQGVLDALYSQK